MGFDSIWHWFLLLVVVLLVFGTRKIRDFGPDIGHALRGFRKAMQGGEDDDDGEKKTTGEKLQADPPPATSQQSTSPGQGDTSGSK